MQNQEQRHQEVDRVAQSLLVAEQESQDTAAPATSAPPPQGDEEERPAPPAVEPSFEDKLATAEAKVEELRDAFLRAKADLENYRRRVKEDIDRAHKYAIERFADSLLPVKDSLETALKVETPTADALKEGVELTLRQLNAAFNRNRLTEINPMPGERLDPEKHHAVSAQPSDRCENCIVSVQQKGYMIADRLLRPAMVTIAQGRAESSLSGL